MRSTTGDASVDGGGRLASRVTGDRRGGLAALIASLLVLGVAVALGGNAVAFVNLPSLLIVAGGTLAAVTLATSWTDVCNACRAMRQCLLPPVGSPAAAGRLALKLADVARRRGVLALQPLLSEPEFHPFLRQGLALAADGLRDDEIDGILRAEAKADGERTREPAAVLRRAAEYAPAMGLIGTLIGLVQMLGHLDSPASIGPSMAIALLTTFYGAVLANVVLAPLAAKIERRVGDEDTIRTIYRLAALSIARRENPRRLEILINSLLPVEQRLDDCDRTLGERRDDACAC